MRDENGKETVSPPATVILTDHGVKDKDIIWHGIDEAKPSGHTKKENMLTTNPDHGIEVSFGIGMSGGGGGPVVQDFSKNAARSISFGELKLILKTTPLSKGYKPGEQSWRKIDKKKASDWIKWIKDRKEQGEKIGEIVEKTNAEVDKNRKSQPHDPNGNTELFTDENGNGGMRPKSESE